jgi:solute carrier family 25 (mitochondrial phosphate transporter), member 23/24/25/41
MAKGNEESEYSSPSRSLEEFRAREGAIRKQRLKQLWQHICENGYLSHPGQRAQIVSNSEITADKVEELRAAYETELFGQCSAHSSKKQIGWNEFKQYALAKEVGTLFFI